MLTHSYIHYLTSNSILIGAEVDKILSISFVTIILAIAVNGSSNLLVTAVAERSAAADFSRFFDSSVAEGIRSAEALEAGRGEKRFATILNVDLRGFTGLADRLDADSVMAVLSAYQGRVIPLVQQHGGIIDKFMGDGIMASFGIGDVDGEVEPGCEANAVRAAEAILLDAERWAGEVPEIAQAGGIEVGIGIASGTVNWGAVGREDRLEMTVIGPAVNLSAKLEKHNKKLASRCICDAETWAAACGQGYDGLLGAEIVHTHIEGTGRNVEIAVLTPNPVPIAPMPQGEPVGRT
jgi:adenylate cyclase